MDKLYDKLALPKGHYHLHRAVLAGLPVSLITELARELGRSPIQVAEWAGSSPLGTAMSMPASEVFLRLVETLDVLLELYGGNLEGTLHWLTTPKAVLGNEQPVDLLVTAAGWRAVQQAIHAIEYGLPV
jgi:putative toxin-antitoxin system antitoxin component (TIGR02293 family)